MSVNAIYMLTMKTPSKEQNQPQMNVSNSKYLNNYIVYNLINRLSYFSYTSDVCQINYYCSLSQNNGYNRSTILNIAMARCLGLASDSF